MFLNLLDISKIGYCNIYYNVSVFQQIMASKTRDHINKKVKMRLLLNAVCYSMEIPPFVCIA